MKTLILREALVEIEKYGHGKGHGMGYSCANIAAKALKDYNTELDAWLDRDAPRIEDLMDRATCLVGVNNVKIILGQLIDCVEAIDSHEKRLKACKTLVVVDESNLDGG